MNNRNRIVRTRSIVSTLLLLLAGAAGVQAQSVYWALTNNATGGNWSAGSSWVGGSAPTSVNNAIILSTNGGFFITNDVNNTVQDLTYTMSVISGTTGPGGAVVTTVVSPGTTLSVLGPDGFNIQHTVAWKGSTTHTFSGQSLVVSNPTASFVLNSGQSIGGSSSASATMNFSTLTNLTATVSLFGGADDRLNGQGPSAGDQSVKVTLARTNIITAQYVGNYNAIDFTNSIEIARNDNIANNSFSQNSFWELGLSNVFNADSFGLGRGQCQGNSSGGLSMGSLTGFFTGANAAGFNVSFQNTNSVTPVSSARFRNADGVSPMTLLTIGVDSGTTATNARNSAVMNLQGGKIDMLVNQIWLGCNRTNAIGNQDSGAFGFDNGTVNANTIYAGYMQYTNPAFCQGFILVGTNGVLRVNNTLELGYTPPDPLGSYIAAENTTVGQLQINNGGVAHVNQIIVGAVSTNNAITIQSGGLLDVTNTIASASGRLTTLTANGGGLTVNINGANPLVFVTNLTATANSPINIASVTGISSYPAVVPVISYVNSTGGTFWAGGSSPAGSGISMLASNDTANSTIDLILSTNLPKHLVWKGYVNNTWDTTTLNWLDTATGLHTNFTTLDYVTFDDTASTGNVNVTANIYVAQFGGTGITVTNNSLNYTFTSSTLSAPNGILGSGSLVKTGTGSLTVDLYIESPATISQGSLAVTANGTMANVSAASGTQVANGGTISGNFNCSGVGLNNGTINGVSTALSGGIITNQNTLAVFTVANGGFLYNAGNISYAIGSTATINTNGTMINAGNISGDVISDGGTLVDLGSGTVTLTSINMLAGGLFVPGGYGIGTTTINNNGNGNFPGEFAGAQNSTLLLKANPGGTPLNTLLSVDYLAFGGSSATRNQNGCTLLISNVGAAYAIGQRFIFFTNEFNLNVPFNTGQSTNTYPVISPVRPGPGMTWDLTQLWVNGSIGVISTAGPVLTNSFALDGTGTNIVGQFSWDPSLFGYRLESLTTSNGAGLTATNWIGIAGSWTTTSETITNTINANTCVFYRLVFP